MRSNDTPTHHDPAISVSQLGRLPVMMTSGSWSWRLALAVSLLLRNSWLPRILWLRGVCNTMGWKSQKWVNTHGSTLMVPTYSDGSKLSTFQGPFQEQSSCYKDFHEKFRNAVVLKIYHMYVVTCCSLAETGTRLQKCKAPIDWSRSHFELLGICLMRCWTHPRSHPDECSCDIWKDYEK